MIPKTSLKFTAMLGLVALLLCVNILADTALYPPDRIHSPINEDIAAHLRTIAARGLGLRQNVLMKIGDSISYNPNLLRSFNRYAEWLRLWNIKAHKRWVLWQIPFGNSNHLNVWNNGGPREGYKDNRPEYFFANGDAHLRKFADVGVIRPGLWCRWHAHFHHIIPAHACHCCFK